MRDPWLARSFKLVGRAGDRVRDRRDLQQGPRRAVRAPARRRVPRSSWTFVAKRTTFGRHVYAVGGNAEAARRAGINVARIRIIVFMISGAMAGLGGIVLAARLNSVDLNAGGGTLLIDAIAAAVIGGTSLFGGRGEVTERALRRDRDLGGLERDVHPRLLDRDDLHRDRLDPPLRRHARHRRAAASDQGRPLASRPDDDDPVGGDVAQAVDAAVRVAHDAAPHGGRVPEPEVDARDPRRRGSSLPACTSRTSVRPSGSVA